ncbi:MAG: radical SAM family heme chaperone HemW [Alphaproteobacteria bacterium]
MHWPFCVSKCPYCDFNSHVSDAVDHDAWRAGLLAELDYYGTKTKGRRLETVFFGGGTPSLMPPKTAAAVLDALSTYWSLAPDMEITLEANPSSVEAGKFADFRAAGVNRVSVGVQSFDDTALRFLGRAHGADEAREAVTLAKQTFDRVSFDLIYALPGQQPEDWARQLEEAVAFDTGHLSLYQLTIEKGTAFFTDHRNGAFYLPDDELAADLYELTSETLSKKELNGYEVSNYAARGQESRHNLIYWRGGDYIGIGPGAHGRVTINDLHYRTEQIPLPANWLSAVAAAGHASRVSDIITQPELMIERLIMGLRLAAGIDRRLFARITGTPLEKSINRARAAALQDAGLIEIDDAGLRATPPGRMRLNALIEALVPE